MGRTAAVKDSGEVVSKAEKSTEAIERVFISRDTPYDVLVDLDMSGKQIFFDEDIKELPQDVLDKLSRLTLIKYQQTLELQKRLAGDDPAFSEINKRIVISQSGYASPRDIAFGNVAKNGLVTKLVREDRIGYWEGKGYRLAAPEHMQSAKMRNVEGHYQHGTIGAPKEYLMVTTSENRAELLKRNDATRRRLDESQIEDIHKKTRDAGLPTFDAD